jgi:hypothetical protein
MEIGDDDPDDHQSQIGDVGRRDVHDDGVEIQLAGQRLAAAARLVIARELAERERVSGGRLRGACSPPSSRKPNLARICGSP